MLTARKSIEECLVAATDNVTEKLKRAAPAELENRDPFRWLIQDSLWHAVTVKADVPAAGKYECFALTWFLSGVKVYVLFSVNDKTFGMSPISIEHIESGLRITITVERENGKTLPRVIQESRFDMCIDGAVQNGSLALFAALKGILHGRKSS